MTEENRLSKPKKSYPFFAISNADQLGPSFGFFGAPQKPPPPLPSCVEVSLFEPEDAIKAHTESLVVGDGDRKVTLLKGRVSTSDVFGVSNSDLVPGKYEGGLKLWEGSIDLVRTLHAEIEEGRLTVEGKRVLECLCRPKGVVYMAGKKHYFGVGGGTRQFIELAEVNGQMKTLLLAEVADGSSNVREVWKLSNE